MPSLSKIDLILASSSPYRKELLSRLKLPFRVLASDIDETPIMGESAESIALRLAQQKALFVSNKIPEAVVIGSDQVATLGGELIGKPGSHATALQQLQKMRGKRVTFHTAICVLDGRINDKKQVAQIQNVQTFVTFRTLPDHELDAYLKAEKPYDCAGSAKNEGLGIILIEKIESTDPTALTGLPLIALTTMLRNIGIGFFNSN